MNDLDVLYSERLAAVAGAFYDATPDVLRRNIEAYLAAIQDVGPAPKAIVVPHAGLIYSGGVAAAAYARLRVAKASVHRVVLIGPSHRVGFRGVAVPSANSFATPIGSVRIDDALRRQVLSHGAVITSDRAHQREHSLEVQLPFLQSVLTDFSLLPLVAGDASPDEVARVLELVWGGPETLIVVSTDLSHFYDAATARAKDAATCRRILALEPRLVGDEACGCVGLNGFLVAAARHGLVARLLDSCNSGDTAGDPYRVVGYGAFAFYEPDKAIA